MMRGEQGTMKDGGESELEGVREEAEGTWGETGERWGLIKY
jgi:hypothetical protein